MRVPPRVREGSSRRELRTLRGSPKRFAGCSARRLPQSSIGAPSGTTSRCQAMPGSRACSRPAACRGAYVSDGDGSEANRISAASVPGAGSAGGAPTPPAWSWVWALGTGGTIPAGNGTGGTLSRGPESSMPSMGGPRSKRSHGWSSSRRRRIATRAARSGLGFRRRGRSREAFRLPSMRAPPSSGMSGRTPSSEQGASTETSVSASGCCIGPCGIGVLPPMSATRSNATARISPFTNTASKDCSPASPARSRLLEPLPSLRPSHDLRRALPGDLPCVSHRSRQSGAQPREHLLSVSSIDETPAVPTRALCAIRFHHAITRPGRPLAFPRSLLAPRLGGACLTALASPSGFDYVCPRSWGCRAWVRLRRHPSNLNRMMPAEGSFPPSASLLPRLPVRVRAPSARPARAPGTANPGPGR